MNVRSIVDAAQVICDAMKRDRVPASIARALAASGWLNTPEAQAELTRLRLLQNAQPAELSDPQLEALINAGNAARNDYYHERACACSKWPAGCVTNPDYANGYWDSDTFAVGMAAVLGVWESMRAPVEADEIARLRAERDAFRNQRNAIAKDSERLIVRADESDEARLLAENATRTAQREIKQLRARVAELEDERHRTNEALSDAAERMRADRDRIAELEAERSRPAPVLDPIAALERIRDDLDAQRYASPDGPPPHFYRLGRDLPEVPRV
ncbi:hypothetical protein [Streptomyces sp. NPDC093093]|uniref:hypothetical protein n=1 Tax=Streptomyces sp. NPDC093093 TaxID=3366025 RepID=UPI003820C148